MRMKIIGIVGLLCCLSAPLGAQQAPLAAATAPSLSLEQVVTTPAGPPPTPEHTGIKAMVKGLVTDFKHLPSRENLFWVGVGGGLALAVHPADDTLNAHLAGHDAFWKPGRIIGSTPVLLGTAVTIYTVGRMKDQPKLS